MEWTASDLKMAPPPMIYTNHTQIDRTKNNRFCNSLGDKRCCLMYWKAYFILSWSGYTHSGRQQWQVKDVCLFWEYLYVLDCYTEFCLKENYVTNYFGMKNSLKFVYYACCDLVIFGIKKINAGNGWCEMNPPIFIFNI